MDPSEMFDLANNHFTSGHYEEAASLYRTLLDISGVDHSRARHGLGVVQFHLGNADLALELIRQATELRPDYPDAYLSLGNIFFELSQIENSIAAYRRCLELRQDSAMAWHNLGNALKANGDFEESLDCYRRAANCGEDDEHKILHEALSLTDSFKHDEAANVIRNGLTRFPESPVLTLVMILILHRQNLSDEALALFEKSRTFLDNHPDTPSTMASILIDLKRHDDAVSYLKQGCDRQSFSAGMRLDLACELMFAGNFEESQKQLFSLDSDRLSSFRHLSSYLYALTLTRNVNEGEILAVSKRFSEVVSKSITNKFNPVVSGVIGPGRIIRIGYVSPDFGQHPVGFHFLPVIRSHDRGRFSVYCYSDRIKEDQVTCEIMEHAAVWRRSRLLTDEQLADVVRADRIDILVDLAGHTAQNRLRMFAMHPAPLQVSWLGYWGTTGLSEIDYVISDDVTVPLGSEEYFVEKVWKLPGCRFCYQPPEYAPSVGPLPAHVKGYLTFGSFNNVSKLNDHVLQLWSEVLKSVPDSRLVLKWSSFSDLSVCGRFEKRLDRFGVAPDRLEFRPASPHQEMLSEYGDIDLALDPFPSSGGMTSCEALWMGVPVLTLPSGRPISRQTAAYLQAIGVDGFAAGSRDEYLQLAVWWSEHLQELSGIRTSLRQRMCDSTLCDGHRFTRNLEDAYRSMLDQKQQCGENAVERTDPPPVVDFDSLFPDELHREAMDLYNQYQFEKARLKLEKAIAVFPHVAVWHNDLGNIHAALGQADEAIRFYQKAIRLNDRYPEAYYNLGLEYQLCGRFHESITEYCRALETYPHYFEAASKLSVVLSDVGRHGEAVSMARRAVEIDPDRAEAWNNLGKALLALGDYVEAVDAFRRATENQPGFTQAYSNMLYALQFDPQASNERIFELSRGWQKYIGHAGSGFGRSL